MPKEYILELLKKANMDHAKSLPTPMTSNLKLSKELGETITNEKQYRSIVGALQYITITRPDLSYSVNKICQFMDRPHSNHWKAVKRILHYLKGTMDHGLHFNDAKRLNIQAYCDADWASDPDDRRSTTGFCIFLGSNLTS